MRIVTGELCLKIKVMKNQFNSIEITEHLQSSTVDLRTSKLVTVSHSQKSRTNSRKVRIMDVVNNKPLEFLAIAKREAFKENRSNTQRNERRAKRK
jgi:hypothetical protein